MAENDDWLCGPKDEHLVLHPDGAAENWTVTAESRSEPVTGHWSVEGKTLTLSFGDNENSQPFTFHEGQLVFPNIPSRRGFWEKIDWEASFAPRGNENGV